MKHTQPWRSLILALSAALVPAWCRAQDDASGLSPLDALPPLAAGPFGDAGPFDVLAEPYEPLRVRPVDFMVPSDLLEQVPEGEREARRRRGVVPSRELEAEAEAAEPTSESVGSVEIEENASADAGTAIQESPSIQTVNIQRRSAIAFDPRVRGYHIGQVYAQGEGIWWNPVRPDMDSMLGRLDPRMIDRLDVIPGPYSVRYGPGFAFIDADLADTPRYYNGCEWHNRSGYTIRANGPQHYAVDTFYGGSANYGYIINYGYRNGADYLAGNGQRIPSSYLLNNVSSQFGVDLAQESRLELRYDFLDQRDTQIPGQFFDIDELESHAFLVSLIDEQCSAPWTRFRLDAWHHRTPMRGSVGNDSAFQIQDRVSAALQNAGNENVTFQGFTNAKLVSSGGRAEALFGEPDSAQLRTGVDLRHVRQSIEESFPIGSITPFPIGTQLLPSEMFNPGMYAELGLPMTSYWTTRWGARVDYVHTTGYLEDPSDTSIPFPDDLKQDDTLYAFYMMNDLQLTDVLTASIGFGEAQRPPTLVERYADGVFVSVLQSGFTRVIGDPRLAPEKLWQLDGGLYADYGDLRGSITAYHAWIQDYITYRGGEVRDPTGALLVRYVSTPLATLTGFEFKTEKDLSSSWTAFIAGHYVQGHDQTLDAPLPGISPLEGIAGLRWHSAEDPDRLGAEFLLRAVDAQNRLGVIRLGNLFDTNEQSTVEQVTGGFTVVHVRGYWVPDEEKRLRIVGGVENLFDRTYLQHLDLRLAGGGGGPPPSGLGPFGRAFAYAPGITPYLGIDWTY
ncbi:MAG TPA: TonB-dependent receptor [Pirellulaceae bacterium]|nr:TonB-dependent receptor [Pirellulaceae bacterium]